MHTTLSLSATSNNGQGERLLTFIFNFFAEKERVLVALQKKFVASSLLRIAKCKTPNTASLFCTISIFLPLRIAVVRKKGHFPHKNQSKHPPRRLPALPWGTR